MSVGTKSWETVTHMVSQVTRRRLSVDDRRNELVEACLYLIGTHPWDEVSMADVAAQAGVSKPLLYHYFATKGDMYLAAVRSAADELSAATRPDSWCSRLVSPPRRASNPSAGASQLGAE